ncbi:uncharacterized protein PgNI_07448 [Pyricularia grisea]|uniref:Uncharacterized protein n=1 Tax=Pyricularia grisea TaxID=148305 RepID=A0A6P8B1L0_PYRGI|nr:uncharacterized protein PgNI_07448 [Pyricularia grisea]TLD08742.1 hypothetical protein PgNI_07448 [Pyricularia grisea]
MPHQARLLDGYRKFPATKICATQLFVQCLRLTLHHTASQQRRRNFQGCTAYHLVVYAFPLQKSGMVTLLDNLALPKHEDYVRILHRRQPMCHDNHRPRPFCLLKDCLNSLFRLRVQVGRRLIQQQQPRIPDQGPSDCQSLLLPAG